MPLPELQSLKEKVTDVEVESSSRIFKDRRRTNFFRQSEQKLIAYLVAKVPASVTSNHLSFLGGLGSLIVFLAFVIAWAINPVWLLAGILGLAINWVGDSLDGRLAYYRNTPRKWYGFALDIIMDWVSTIFIGFGYYVYADSGFKWLGFLFVVFYGWAILIAQLRYKITDRYTIDSGAVGPTELRVIIALILVTEVAFAGTIHYAAILISLTLFILNLKDTLQLLREGDKRDKEEKGLLH